MTVLNRDNRTIQLPESSLQNPPVGDPYRRGIFAAGSGPRQDFDFFCG